MFAEEILMLFSCCYVFFGVQECCDNSTGTHFFKSKNSYER